MSQNSDRLVGGQALAEMPVNVALEVLRRLGQEHVPSDRYYGPVGFLAAFAVVQKAATCQDVTRE